MKATFASISFFDHFAYSAKLALVPFIIRMYFMSFLLLSILALAGGFSWCSRSTRGILDIPLRRFWGKAHYLPHFDGHVGWHSAGSWRHGNSAGDGVGSLGSTDVNDPVAE